MGTHPDDTVLDVGCGIGGPGRFLVERFGCAVTGVDLQARVDVAAEFTRRTAHHGLEVALAEGSRMGPMPSAGVGNRGRRHG